MHFCHFETASEVLDIASQHDFHSLEFSDFYPKGAKSEIPLQPGTKFCTTLQVIRVIPIILRTLSVQPEILLYI